MIDETALAADAPPEGPAVVGTFTSLIEAEMARSRLQAAGIEALLESGNLVGVAWHLSNAVGGVKLIVPAANAEEARRVLEERGGDESARVEPADGERADAQDEAPSPADELARRAWSAAVLGLVVAPVLLHAWALWLLRESARAGGAQTPRGKRQAWLAGGLSAVILCAAAAFAAHALFG